MFAGYETRKWSLDILPFVTVPLAWHWFGWHGGVIAILLVSHFKIQWER